jgi:hypothetical protein
MSIELQKRTWNWYLANPSLVLVVEKQWNKPLGLIPFGEIERLYAVWKDGESMGRYDEATKDAEGS